MNSFWIMLSHVYMTRIKSKPFIISTVIVAASIFLLSNFDTITSVFNDEEDKLETVAVVDETASAVFHILEEQLSVLNETVALESTVAPIEELEEGVKEGTYAGILRLHDGGNGLPEATYLSMSLTPSRVTFDINAALQGTYSAIVSTQLNLSPEDIAKLTTPVTFTQEALVEGARTMEEMSQARGIVYVLLFFIYFAVVFYSNMIATEVATEKSSRIMEILISSVSPVKQMFAKILGVGAAGLTQMTLLLLIGYTSVVRRQEELVGDFFEYFGFGDLSIEIVVYAIVFFLLGYFLYATLAALLGSLVSRTEDVQYMILPMMFFVIIGFLIAMLGLNNPESTLVTITSYIPFFTPMVMFLRVVMLNIPAVQPLIGILILLGSIGLLGWFGARVYRGGVLMYGNSNSLKDIKRALELGKK